MEELNGCEDWVLTVRVDENPVIRKLVQHKVVVVLPKIFRYIVPPIVLFQKNLPLHQTVIFFGIIINQNILFTMLLQFLFILIE